MSNGRNAARSRLLTLEFLSRPSPRLSALTAPASANSPATRGRQTNILAQAKFCSPATGAQKFAPSISNPLGASLTLVARQGDFDRLRRGRTWQPERADPRP